MRNKKLEKGESVHDKQRAHIKCSFRKLQSYEGKLENREENKNENLLKILTMQNEVEKY